MLPAFTSLKSAISCEFSQHVTRFATPFTVAVEAGFSVSGVLAEVALSYPQPSLRVYATGCGDPVARLDAERPQRADHAIDRTPSQGGVPGEHGEPRDAGHDPGEVQGYAFGLGLERLAELKLGLKSVHELWRHPYLQPQP